MPPARSAVERWRRRGLVGSARSAPDGRRSPVPARVWAAAASTAAGTQTDAVAGRAPARAGNTGHSDPRRLSALHTRRGLACSDPLARAARRAWPTGACGLRACIKKRSALPARASLPRAERRRQPTWRRSGGAPRGGGAPEVLEHPVAGPVAGRAAVEAAVCRR